LYEQQVYASEVNGVKVATIKQTGLCRMVDTLISNLDRFEEFYSNGSYIAKCGACINLSVSDSINNIF